MLRRTTLLLSVILSQLSLQHRSFAVVGSLNQLGLKAKFIEVCLSRLAMSKRIILWLLQLNKFNTTVVTPKGSISQALLDLVQFSSRKCEALHKDLSYKKVCFVEAREWCLLSMALLLKRRWGRVLLHAPNVTNISLVFELGVLCSNTDAGYEALITSSSLP